MLREYGHIDNEHQERVGGISRMGMELVKQFYTTEESREGVRAFREKRKPEFRKYVK